MTRVASWIRTEREAAPARFERRRSDAWAALVGLAVLVACMWLVRDGEVGDAEESVFRAINDLPDSLKAPLWLGQLPGLLITPLLAAAVFVVFRRYRLAMASAALVPLKLFFERSVVKVLVERERPFQLLGDVVQRDDSTAGLSFPSGHAILAFGLAALLVPYVSRRWQVVVYAIALLNGFARVYLGAHNPLDIVGGAALGLVLAAALNLLAGVPGSDEAGDPAHRRAGTAGAG